MPTVREMAMETTDKLKTARLHVVALPAELAQAEYDFRLAKARVERCLIKKVGREKVLAPMVDGRERIFTLALDADANYKSQWQRRHEMTRQLDEAKIEVVTLRDQLHLLLASLPAAGTDQYA